MSRRYDRPIECACDSTGRPTRFRWRGKAYRVTEVLDSWIEVGEWWIGEPETVWFRVQTQDRGLFELYIPSEGGTWRLWKVLD